MMVVPFSSMQAIAGDPLLEAASSGGWGNASSNSGDSSSSSDITAPVSSTQQQAPVVCTKDKQTSMSYKSFLALFEKGSKMSISRNAGAGTLTLSGGKMIANCNNMLDFNFYQPKDGRPYLFQVSFKKPDGCSADKCTYNVNLAEDGIAIGEMKEIEVAPNYDGFKECLKLTGVMDENNKYVEDNIASLDFKHHETGVQARNKLYFYSHGPEASKRGGVYSGNKLSENSCRFYEDIAKDGYTIYSKSDVERNRKEVIFNDICNNGNYLEISRRLPEFAEFETMYNSLLKVRDAKILDEIQDLHTELKGKDYSSFDVDKYKRTIQDFYNEIVLPRKKQIEALVTQKAKTSNKDDKKRIEGEIKTLVKELLKYNKSPYITVKDYANMRSFIPKSPLHEEAWREAALLVYKSNNTAHHYSRFDEATRVSRDLELASIGEVRELVEADFSKQEDKMKQLGRLATDHDSSYVSDYTQKAESLKYDQQLFNQESQYMVQQELASIQQKCMNPRMYWIVNNPLMQRNCIQKAQANAAMISEDTQFFNQDVQRSLQGYQTQINSWGSIEAQRNAAYGVKPSNNTSRQIDPRSMRDPRFSQMMSANNLMQNNSPQFFQQQSTLRQSTFQQPNQNGRVYTQPFGPSIPFNPINSGANEQFQFGIVNQQRGPAMMYQQQQMPAPMMNYQNSQQYQLYR